MREQGRLFTQINLDRSDGSELGNRSRYGFTSTKYAVSLFTERLSTPFTLIRSRLALNTW